MKIEKKLFLLDIPKEARKRQQMQLLQIKIAFYLILQLLIYLHMDLMKIIIAQVHI